MILAERQIRDELLTKNCLLFMARRFSQNANGDSLHETVNFL